MGLRRHRHTSMPTMDQVEAERKRTEYKTRYKQTLGSTISALLVIAAVAVLISTLFLPVVQVVGNSMEPTLHDGDIYVLVKSNSYKRGDICCISWQNKKLLKRVIGLPEILLPSKMMEMFMSMTNILWKAMLLTKQGSL